MANKFQWRTQENMKSAPGNPNFSPTMILVITVFIDITGYGIIIPLLPFYTSQFQAGPTALGVLLASFAFMQFLFAPILGKASDNLGRKPILLLSLLISFIGFTIFSFSNSYLMLLLSRIIAGLATERAVAQAYIADITDKETRTKELGKIGAALGAGFIIGPALGGILSVYGYSIPGYIAMILTGINVAFVFAFLKESRREKTPQEKPGKSYLGELGNSIKKPLIGPTLFILFIVTFAFSTIPVVVPLLSIDYFNFSSLELSYIFIYIGLIQIFMQGFLIGKISKRFGEEKLIAAGSIIMAVGTFLMPIFRNLAAFYLTNAALAAGVGLTNTAIPAFLSKRASSNEQGSVLGVASSVTSISNIPGPLFAGLIYDLAGSIAPFAISAAFLTAAFAIGFKVYQLNSGTVRLST
jgi:MFS family permease